MRDVTSGADEERNMHESWTFGAWGGLPTDCWIASGRNHSSSVWSILEARA
jgi:hypothetical protein